MSVILVPTVLPTDNKEEQDTWIEPILRPNVGRFVLFPIQHKPLWDMYKKHQATIWTAEEVDLSQDYRDWDKMSEDVRHFITWILAFFAASDGIVNENLAERFLTEIQIPEARCFYGFQIAMENVHAETYSLLLDTYIPDPKEKTKLLNAITTIPTVQAKAEWALHWIKDDAPFAERLLAFICVEGIFFSGSFCGIFWAKKQGILPGLTFSNEMISKDENLHVEFACLLYNQYIQRQVPQARVHEMFKSAVRVEQEFDRDALKHPLKAMNADMMCQYIEYVCDWLLHGLGYDKIYHSRNPFPFMVLMSIPGKASFHEKRNETYKKAGVGDSKRGFDPNQDF